MTSNTQLTRRCQSGLLLPGEKMMLKRRMYFYKKQIFQGSDEHFTFLMSLNWTAPGNWHYLKLNAEKVLLKLPKANSFRSCDCSCSCHE